MNNFKFTKTPIDGVKLIMSNVMNDNRGLFFESFRKDLFADNGINEDFVQENISVSKNNVIRGLHYQTDPNAQGKLIKVLKGKILDIALDIRKDSKSYGCYFGVLLKENDGRYFYLPPGLAHGFVSKEDNTIVMYKCTKYYNKDNERGILWNDPELNISWGIDEKEAIVSDKDKENKRFSQI